MTTARNQNQSNQSTPEAHEPENQVREVEQGPAQMTMPKLLGTIVQRVAENPAYMAQAKKDLYLWCMAQDDEDRKALAMKAKKSVETLKLTGESLFMTIVEITSGEQ